MCFKWATCCKLVSVKLVLHGFQFWLFVVSMWGGFFRLMKILYQVGCRGRVIRCLYVVSCVQEALRDGIMCLVIEIFVSCGSFVVFSVVLNRGRGFLVVHCGRGCSWNYF